MKMEKEKTKLKDELSIKLYRNGKLITTRQTKKKEDRLMKILKFLLSLFGGQE